MIAVSTESHAVFTHCVTIGNDGLFRLPAAVCSTVSDIIHADHCSRSLHLKVWFTETPSGCKIEVRPPVMTAMLVLWPLLVRCLTLSTRCAHNWSQTSRLFVLTIIPTSQRTDMVRWNIIVPGAVWEERITREDNWLHSAGWPICVIMWTRRRVYCNHFEMGTIKFYINMKTCPSLYIINACLVKGIPIGYCYI